ncbi:histidine kinase [Aurantibacter sp.]|uniref:tetratricopeptide repeat-containing sensor histidine kinase n=1 Tax=Aurantibacter sp. TaxID=2807103 RepID=UPI0035C7E246
MKHLLLYILILFSASAFAQNDNALYNNELDNLFTLKGLVQENKNNPINNVVIKVNGGFYAKTNNLGEFSLQVKIGDVVTITHQDFNTVDYNVESKEDILIVVESFSETIQQVEIVETPYTKALDSAKFYKTISAEKSAQFVVEGISYSKSVNDNARAFEILAETYMYWKQYDLAITNYRISLNNTNSNSVKLKLAQAYFLNNNLVKSLDVYNNVKSEELSNWDLISKNEGVADVYFKSNKIKEALNLYKKALVKASETKIKLKQIELNSKIAEVYKKMRAYSEAENYYNKALNLAGKESKKRLIEEKVKVADFKNEINKYDDEIEARESIIKDVIIESPKMSFPNESALTLQKQNYKIGNAFYLKKEYNQAVPYLEKSIKIASDKEDLIVEKDATKKLSEVYSASKKYDKALETYKEYTNLVEALYIKKEQEISQAIRFSKRLAEKQNRITSLETDRQLALSQVELTSEKTKRQQLVIYSLIGGLFLVLLLAYLMFKFIKQQRLANNLLALKSLRSQMNPHFIFNALNSVNSFIAVNDERTANKYLSDFSKLMRSVLENSEEDFIPLENEIDLIRRYTKLEHFRFQDKFDYTISVDEKITISDYKIPPMLLQPYIENAVWHGLRYKEEKGVLDINISLVKVSSIKITITDNGIGREQSKALKTNNQKKHNSKGLGNISKRVEILNNMYKDKISVSVLDNPIETGTLVILTLRKE